MKEKHEGVIMWVKFRCVFREEYLPQDYIHQMKFKFMELTQGHMIVAKCKVKFDEHVSYILTLKESDQIDFFMNGLDKSIKFVVQSHELTMEMEAYRKGITLESQHKA
jgi:hypothetical protein